jgi:hypothetical protein
MQSRVLGACDHRHGWKVRRSRMASATSKPPADGGRRRRVVNSAPSGAVRVTARDLAIAASVAQWRFALSVERRQKSRTIQKRLDKHTPHGRRGGSPSQRETLNLRTPLVGQKFDARRRQKRNRDVERFRGVSSTVMWYWRTSCSSCRGTRPTRSAPSVVSQPAPPSMARETSEASPRLSGARR